MHAILGCDTTSRIQNIGKRLAFLKLLSDETFKQSADKFYDSDVSSEEVIGAGGAYGVVVSMFDFHRSDGGSNPGRGGKIS